MASQTTEVKWRRENTESHEKDSVITKLSRADQKESLLECRVKNATTSHVGPGRAGLLGLFREEISHRCCFSEASNTNTVAGIWHSEANYSNKGKTDGTEGTPAGTVVPQNHVICFGFPCLHALPAPDQVWSGFLRNASMTCVM